MNKKYWEQKLVEYREAILELDDSASASRDSVTLDQQKVGRLSRMDALQEQAMNQAVSARRQQSLLRIEAALERLEEGEFGFCQICGDAIPEKRLELDPTTPNCVNCQQ
jgi:DnaK suppressor protein